MSRDEYEPHLRFPEDPTPAEVSLILLCFVSQPDVRWSYDGEPITTVPHAQCRYCDLYRPAQGAWLDSHVGVVRPPRSRARKTL